jgi:hypothetical protein
MDELDALLTKWDEAKKAADYWTTLEKALRQQIFTSQFPVPVIGTNKAKINHGMALIGTYKINYKIDKPVMDSMLKEPELQALVHQVVNFEPKIREGELKKLTDNERGQIAAMLTETPGMPTIELKPASKVRW